MSNEDEPPKKFAEVAFDEALTDLATNDDTIDKLISNFEDSAQVDDEGEEFWFARDLQGLLGYTKWDNFLTVIAKAKAACDKSGNVTDDHFAGVGKMVSVGSGAEREIEDIILSRYACYLAAQNADAKKRPVAFAQTYFAIQTRRQEVRQQEEQEYQSLSEDERRIMLREEVKTHNKHLASAAKGAGVHQGLDYAIFQTEGYKGLYGGLDVPGIRRRKGLRKNQAVLDHMGSTELAANLFRATQTEDKLRRENVQGKAAANRAHYEVGAKVRQTIKDIGGTMPEQLPAAEDIKKVGRRIGKEQQAQIAEQKKD
ncbi:DNA damage-inducible protein D [Hyphobacterium sp.]|jgi:DNA-damage-inducible protein D|uniref:DNA damage-inducible protein D n=1 Tax=Hyphobacterium sp. TaxID=2004662 RepID=UPI003BAB987A